MTEITRNEQVSAVTVDGITLTFTPDSHGRCGIEARWALPGQPDGAISRPIGTCHVVPDIETPALAGLLRSRAERHVGEWVAILDEAGEDIADSAVRAAGRIYAPTLPALRDEVGAYLARRGRWWA